MRNFFGGGGNSFGGGPSPYFSQEDQLFLDLNE